MRKSSDFCCTSKSKTPCTMAGYMPSGKSGSSARYALSRILHCGGIMLLASSIEIGTTANVPLMVPVALLG